MFKHKLLILDRDGVINRSPIPPQRYVLRIEDLILNELEISNLRYQFSKLQYIAIATNQQCLGKGLISINKMSEIHKEVSKFIMNIFNIQPTFFICPHLTESNCACRKPKPGLLNDAIYFYSVERSETIFIGDQLSDERAAIAANIEFKYLQNLNI